MGTVTAMIEKAKALVIDYIEQHLDRSNPTTEYAIFVVWQARALQNFKCLISTTALLGMYFELTYDGDFDRWYFDAYRKVENRVVADGIQEQPDAGAD